MKRAGDFLARLERIGQLLHTRGVGDPLRNICAKGFCLPSAFGKPRNRFPYRVSTE